MECIKAAIKQRKKEYQIFIGSSIAPKIAEYINKKHNGKKIAIITDENVKKIANALIASLSNLLPHIITVPYGESSKSREMKEKIENELLEKKYGRDTIIIAIGGGVIGDLAGFVASTYNRGIPIIHAPTTLLAMVDSSIGGKTGVNTMHGKNLIGTIYQPDAVFIDINFLETLQQEEFLNGMAEIIKISITSDKNLFDFIEKNMEKILKREKNILIDMIKRGIELKKNVVEKDAEEHGLRQVLNFGHTFGHALESYHEYKIKHGNCVSLGIAAEAKIAFLSGELKKENFDRIISLLNSLGLPTQIKQIKGEIGKININAEKIIEIMKLDKKSKNQKPRFVIINSIGSIKTGNKNFSFEIDDGIIKKSIELCKND